MACGVCKNIEQLDFYVKNRVCNLFLYILLFWVVNLSLLYIHHLAYTYETLTLEKQKGYKSMRHTKFELVSHGTIKPLKSHIWACTF